MSRIKFFIFLIFVGFSSCTGSYLINSRQASYIPIENQKEDESIETMIKPYRDSLSTQMNEIIGKSEMEMKSGQPESLLGNFICDMILNDEYSILIENNDQLRDYSNTIVLLNYRGLRAPLHQGEIKVGDIFEIMPFENTIVYVQLTGKEIINMTEYLINYGGQPVSSNYKLIVNSDNSYEVTINGMKIDSAQIYNVITTDYLATGGDNMTFLANSKNVLDFNIKLREFIIKGIKYYTNNKKLINSSLDGRITFNK